MHICVCVCVCARGCSDIWVNVCTCVRSYVFVNASLWKSLCESVCECVRERGRKVDVKPISSESGQG